MSPTLFTLLVHMSYTVDTIVPCLTFDLVGPYVIHLWYCCSMSPTFLPCWFICPTLLILLFHVSYIFTLLVHMSYTFDTVVPCLPHFYLVGPYVLHLWYCCSMSPTFFTLLLKMSNNFDTVVAHLPHFWPCCSKWPTLSILLYHIPTLLTRV